LRVTAGGGDIDELAHVSNLVYLRWVQDVAIAHSTQVGWSTDGYLKRQGAFVARRHEIDYLAPAVEGDAIDLITWIEKWTAVTSLRETRMVRVADGRELAQAVTTWAFVSTVTGRPQRIPPDIIAAFTGARA
jgi:acyl-CoA thioester hydrolase